MLLLVRRKEEKYHYPFPSLPGGKLCQVPLPNTGELAALCAIDSGVMQWETGITEEKIAVDKTVHIQL